jgi:cytochrome b6-f complex iron-sulfur subunit
MPKPQKQHCNDHPGEGSSRRSFLNKLWIGLGIVAVIEFIGIVTAFLRPRKTKAKAGDFGTIIEAGPVEKIPLDSVTAFVRGRFYLARLEDGGFLALSRKCTHLGCTVPWVSGEKKFICPCHSSAFDIRGEVISPPAPRALDIYHVFIENNIVKVETGQRIKRTEFRAEHVTYPKKRIDRITG